MQSEMDEVDDTTIEGAESTVEALVRPVVSESDYGIPWQWQMEYTPEDRGRSPAQHVMVTFNGAEARLYADGDCVHSLRAPDADLVEEQADEIASLSVEKGALERALERANYAYAGAQQFYEDRTRRLADLMTSAAMRLAAIIPDEEQVWLSLEEAQLIEEILRHKGFSVYSPPMLDYNAAPAGRYVVTVNADGPRTVQSWTEFLEVMRHPSRLDH